MLNRLTTKVRGKKAFDPWESRGAPNQKFKSKAQKPEGKKGNKKVSGR